METFLHQVVAGLATGGIYASVALALVMIYQATHHINFAQGEMAMFSTYLAWTMIDAGMPYWVTFFAAVLLAFVLGAAIERIIVRPVENASALTVVVVFIGTGLAPLRIRFQFSPFDGTSQLRDGWYWGRFGFSMVNISLGVLLLAMVRNGEWIVSRFMSWRPLREVGIRSYCIYLIHVPLAVIMFEQWGERDSKGEFKPDPVLFLSYLVALVVLTQLSHKYLEQPLMRKGKELRSRQKAAAS